MVLGGGSAGETAAARVAQGGCSVALVESRLVGGECPYWGCVPSKALLIAASRRRQAMRAHELGATASPVDVGDAGRAWAAAVQLRDKRAENRDDSNTVKHLQSQGVEIVRGEGKIAAPGRVEVVGRTLAYGQLLISVGADAVMPPIDGLADSDAWTSDDALTSDELPESMVILGGGAIGVELAQVYSAFGCRVTIVEAVDRVLALEEPEVSAVTAEVLAETGVEVRVGVGVERVSSANGATTLHLADGSSVSAARLLVATGRRPRLKGYGFEHLGIDTDASALDVGLDGRVQGHRKVFAAGDVTGRFPFTHTANYAGRVVAANVLGGDVLMNLDAVPRGVFIDPPVAGVGLATEQARKEGYETLRTTIDIGDTARAWLEDERGVLVLVADASTGVLIGASAIGPRADEWIAQVTLAIRANVPLATLADTIQPFPAVSEALFPAYEDLAKRLR